MPLDYIFIDDNEIRFTYDPSAASYDDEGRLLGDDLLTWRFSIGSGAYDVVVDYEAEAANAYVELFSESWVAEPVSEKVYLSAGETETVTKMYIPFARSMHDVQMNIHYTGPGSLKVYSVSLLEDVSYRWVPVAGYIIFIIVLDMILYIIFSGSAAGIRARIRENPQILGLIVVVILASLPAFTDFLYVGHDIRFHLARIIAVSREISYGKFPVRMLTDMLGGYGYPTSIFYCDLFLYPFAFLYYLGMPLYMCWQLNIIVLNTVTAWISYRSFKRISGRPDLGAVGAAVYTLRAYRMVDIYLRDALGEFTAMTFIPLILAGMWILYYEEEEDKDGWLCLGAGMTGVALCHSLSVEMITVFLVFFCLMEYRKTFIRYRLLSIIKAALMTVLLSCWFIFPMLMSMRGISLNMYQNQKYMQVNGAYLSQLFNPFMAGTGYSGLATYGEMPLSIGGGMIVALAMLIYRILKKGDADRHKQRVALVMVSLSMIFSLCAFPWDSIAGMSQGRIDIIANIALMVQLPWRYLEIAAGLLSVTAVCGLKAESEYTHYREKSGAWKVALLLGTLISLWSFFNNVITDMKWTRAADESYLDDGIAAEEYLPAESGRVDDLPVEVEIAEGTGVTIGRYEAVDGERRLSISNPGGAARVLIPVFAYPGYHAEDMSSHATIGYRKGESARIELEIPGGYGGTIRVYYKEPGLWRVFEMVSAISFICFVAYLIKVRRSRPGGEER